MKLIWCRGCRGWFDGKLRACPDCGTERYGHSVHLHTAMLNNHLYRQAEQQLAGRR